jgi:hypothetical protein
MQRRDQGDPSAFPWVKRAQPARRASGPERGEVQRLRKQDPTFGTRAERALYHRGRLTPGPSGHDGRAPHVAVAHPMQSG